jgi:hypothetical protein
MANSPIVTSLPTYVDQNRLPLIAKAVLGAKTASLFTLQSGVKSPTALNLISTDVVFGDGSTCGWNEAGSTTLSQRILTPAALKVNMAFCDKKLLDKWANYQVQVAAGSKTLPFEEDFVTSITASVDEKLEQMIWQGDSTKSGVNEFDGMIKILEASGAGTVKVAIAKGTASYDAIKSVAAAIPNESYAEDTVIFVGMEIFRKFIAELVAANLYHYNPNDKEGEYTLPGTALKVIAVNGLNGTNKIVAGRLSNMFYGTDLAGDEEVYKLWYSEDNREFRLVIEFIGGVQVAYPDQIVLGTIATA